MDGALEQGLDDLLYAMDFDLRYIEYCKGFQRPPFSVAGLPIQEIVACVDALPLAVKYVKSEGGWFRYREKRGEWTLALHLTKHPVYIGPRLYLMKAGLVLGTDFTSIALRLFDRREGREPDRRPEVLWFATKEELRDRLDFALSLFLEIREAVWNTEPWSSSVRSV